MHAKATRIRGSFFIRVGPHFQDLRVGFGRRFILLLWRGPGSARMLILQFGEAGLRGFDAARAAGVGWGDQAVRMRARAVRSSQRGTFPPKSLTEFRMEEQSASAPLAGAFWKSCLTRSRLNSSEEPLVRPSQAMRPRETRRRAADFSSATMRASAVAWENRPRGSPVESSSEMPVASRRSPGMWPALV